MTVVSSCYYPYDFNVNLRPKSAQILMQFHTQVLRTNAIPFTLSFLQQQYPQVLDTCCFNDHHKPFHIEVLDTELGHLFEHIVLAKLSATTANKTYKGWTQWDWKRNSRGSFSISLNVGKNEEQNVRAAIAHADSLLYRLLLQHTDGWGVQPSVQISEQTVNKLRH